MKHLSSEAVGRLIAAETDRDRLLFRLTYEHARRISETLALTRAHVRRGYLDERPKYVPRDGYFLHHPESARPLQGLACRQGFSPSRKIGAR